MEIMNNDLPVKEVFCRFIRKNGKIIYPKNARFFHFWISDHASDESMNASQDSQNRKPNN